MLLPLKLFLTVLVLHQLQFLLAARRLQPAQRITDDSKKYNFRKSPWYYQKLASSNFSSSDIFLMLNKKTRLLVTLEQHIRSIHSNPEISPEARLRLELLEVFKNELKATEKSLVAVLNDLNQTVNSDYSSLEKIKESCSVRLGDTRDAAVQVEEDYNTIVELEKEMKSLHPNTSFQTHYHIINDIVKDISHAADDLESFLHEHLFSDSKKIEGAKIETVIKLRDRAVEHSIFHSVSGKPSDKQEEQKLQEGMSILVDSSSNQYILSRPHDVTIPIEDHHLVYDIVYLLLLSFLFGSMCSLLRVPSSFGYIFAGTLLGPTGYNCIESVVQVETIGEFGVMFTVFVVGLEFTPERLRKVWNIAVYGGNLLFVCGIALAVLLGLMVSVHPSHSLFVAACLSLSSGLLAKRLISNANPNSRPPGELKVTPQNPVSLTDSYSDSDLSMSLAGLLVIQDIQLGFLVALMPFMNESDSGWLLWALQLLQVIFGFPLLLFLTRGLTSRLLEMFYKVLESTLNKSANLLLGSLAVCFILFLVAELLGASMELGCFLAGVAVSSQVLSAGKVMNLVKPVRDLFSVFFFASLGFHVFPTFLRSEFMTVCAVTVFIIILKFSLTVGVLGFFLGHCHPATWTLSLSLAEMSEFSFVLASRGRRLGIISREVYLIILSTATVSLLLAPLLWHFVLFRSKLKKNFLRLLARSVLKLVKLPSTVLSRVRHVSSSSPAKRFPQQ